MSSINSAVDVGAGSNFSCAVVTGGNVQCWGVNSNGRLGTGTFTLDPDSNPNNSGNTTRRLMPVNTTIDGTVGNVATAVDLGVDHACAVLDDTTARCWGYNLRGQLGDNTTVDKPGPVTVLESDGQAGTQPLTGVVDISAGELHTCALINDGTVRCWGFGSSGRLGNGGFVSSSLAVAVSGIDGQTAATTAVSISANGKHSCSLMDDGLVKCWGTNSWGQVGDRTTTSRTTPVNVLGIFASNPATAVSAGSDHTCVILSGGNLRCWGNNGSGRLGDNTGLNFNRPVGVDVPYGALP